MAVWEDQEPEPIMSSGYDLRHAFHPCTSEGCIGGQEHCMYSWCGAPREHSLHLSADDDSEVK